MKLLLAIYSGSQPRLVPELFDRHGAGGWTELPPAHGVGTTGRREGTRAWPGDARLYMSMVPREQAEALVEALRTESKTLQPGESLHVGVLPMETFF